jgi:heme-degrading monooxygenase HmoA
LRDLEEPDRYVVIDRWESIEAYNRFIAEYQQEYLERSDESRLYYLQELRFGAFENVWAE